MVAFLDRLPCWPSATPAEDKEVEDAKVCKRLELYPRFSAFIYSMETFVPLLKLAVGQYWIPNANRGRQVAGLAKVDPDNRRTASYPREMETALVWKNKDIFKNATGDMGSLVTHVFLVAHYRWLGVHDALGSWSNRLGEDLIDRVCASGGKTRGFRRAGLKSIIAGGR